ncbi:unnamed protein product, partial [Effrenium voratum]
VNNITMWPLLKYFRGPEVQRVLFKLAYSFIISFQGIHAIAPHLSATPGFRN